MAPRRSLLAVWTDGANPPQRRPPSFCRPRSYVHRAKRFETPIDKLKATSPFRPALASNLSTNEHCRSTAETNSWASAHALLCTSQVMVDPQQVIDIHPERGLFDVDLSGDVGVA